MRQTAQEAQGRWPGILQSLGVDARYLRDVHGPCPVCGGKDRFRFDDQGCGSWFCSHCTKKGQRPDGFSLLQALHGWDFTKAANEVDRVLGTIPQAPAPRTPKKTDEEKRREKRAKASRMWREAQPVTAGDPVWQYLTRRCGNVAGVLDQVRYHPELEYPYDHTFRPALLARMVHEVGGQAVGTQRIYLTRDGHKASVSPAKLTVGEVGFVQLGPVMEVMGIAEGIETALCAQQRFGVPVWAAISADGMSKWRPPVGCKSVLVCGDNDASFAGQATAYGLARELSRQGIEARVEIPPRVGTDWADMFMEGAA